MPKQVEKEKKVKKSKDMDVGNGKGVLFLEQKGKGVEKGQELINVDKPWITMYSIEKQSRNQTDKIKKELGHEMGSSSSIMRNKCNNGMQCI